MGGRLIEFAILTIFIGIQHNAVSGLPYKIVNGTTASPGEFPYMVQLRSSGGYFTCGGSIIAPNWILTAAHCVDDGTIESIVYGTNQLYDGPEIIPDTTIKVKSWYTHPNFTTIPPDIPIYDVGLLKLEESIPLSETAQVLQIADNDTTIPIHVPGVLSGWGITETTGDIADNLQKISLPLLSDQECIDKIDGFRLINFNPAHNLCSDNYYNGACYGDSGNPYVINNIQYGVVSWSVRPCGVIPSAYSRITNPEYSDWIKDIVNNK